MIKIMTRMDMFNVYVFYADQGIVDEAVLLLRLNKSIPLQLTELPSV